MQSKQIKKSMAEMTQEHSIKKIANSRHLIEEKDKHLFKEVSPKSLTANKAELVGKDSIWVSNDEAATKELCSNIKSGDWQKVLDTHYYPQLAMAGYLSDQITLDEIQTTLFIYSHSVENPDPKIEVYQDCLSFKYEKQEITLLTALKVWHETAGGLNDPVDEARFVKEYRSLPASQRVFLIVQAANDVDIVHSMGILNLYFQCMPTKIPHKHLQGRLGFLSLDEIESSVRKNQRYLGLSYPGSAHFPIHMMDYGVPHDLAHIVQQLATTQETLDLATHLMDAARKITGVQWNMYIWELIDNPLNLGRWSDPEGNYLGYMLDSLFKHGHILFVSLAVLDVLINTETYNKLKCNTKMILDLIPNIEHLQKHFRQEDNIQVKVLITSAYCLLTQKSPTKFNLFSDIASAIRAKVDVSKVNYMRKKVGKNNELQMYYGVKQTKDNKQVTFETIESFLDALGLGDLLTSSTSQAQTQFFKHQAAAPPDAGTTTESPTVGPK